MDRLHLKLSEGAENSWTPAYVQVTSCQMVILGIDPGTRLTGFGILEIKREVSVRKAGVIRLNGEHLPQRLIQLVENLTILYREFRPSVTVVEKIFFGKNADSAFKLGHARGVCLMTAARENSHVEEYAAKYVKKAITGSGASTKEHVRLVVTRLLRYTPESSELDVSDALALALCHSRELEIAAQTARALGRNL